MWVKSTPLSALMFGVTYIGCGLVQVAAGICFLLIPTVLRTGSNAWTGLLTLLSGCLLLNISHQKAKAKVILGIHTGVLLTNLCNLLLTELSEWRAFLASDPLKEFIRHSHVTILLIAYFSTAVPTVIAFVVSFLATQYTCCIFVTGKTSKNLNKKWNGSSIRSSISYDWVFQDREENIEDQTIHIALQHLMSEKSHLDPLACKDYSIRDSGAATALSVTFPDDDTSSLRTFSTAFRNVPATFHPCNWSPAVDSTSRLKDSVPLQTLQGKDIDEISSIKVQNAGHLPSLCFYYSLNSNDNNAISKLSSFVDTVCLSTSRGNDGNNIRESCAVLPKVPAVHPIHEVQCRLHVSKQIAYSSEMPQIEWCLPSRPLVPMDNDSLVNLKHLELLARQWRVDHEHKKLYNTIAKRMTRHFV